MLNETELEAQVAALKAENQRLKSALSFYAGQQHLAGDFDDTWELNVTGDQPNWIDNTLSDATQSVETGRVAQEALDQSYTSDDVMLDEKAVDAFALAMKEKLALARKKGRCGWQDKDATPSENLCRGLLGHLSKSNDGNYIDIANFCMMLHQRNDQVAVLSDVFDEEVLRAIQNNTVAELSNRFPTMLRKMWSGGEVRDWIKQHAFNN